MHSFTLMPRLMQSTRALTRPPTCLLLVLSLADAPPNDYYSVIASIGKGGSDVKIDESWVNCNELVEITGTQESNQVALHMHVAFQTGHALGIIGR
jgi:hypothetical protein